MFNHLGLQQIAVDEHGAAFMALLKDRLSAPTRQIDEPDAQGNRGEAGDQKRAEQTSQSFRPGRLDLRDRLDDRHDRAAHAAIGQRQVHALHRIEIDPVPGEGIELHQDELDLVLVEGEGEDQRIGDKKDDRPDDERELGSREEHQHLMGEELRAAGEIP
ncbi:hypothetical protein PX554_20140 [Sphingomonas sp. H39-1-10]|uniref:hypothetical protein n=1 Tax=Sphingomonas pollutisoli TaxID=3030829 RepID=UPI0023B96511|nr:hypothetical protein [Sphingomonas pollutisoli]MDF0490444.1 hypothetical protein [Sphingomonas pollutisoli]